MGQSSYTAAYQSDAVKLTKELGARPSVAAPISAARGDNAMMRELLIRGVMEYRPNVFSDERGSVVKIFHRPTFEALGIDCAYGETLVSRNRHSGTIRGFHFQYPPYAQSKLIYCVSGACKNFVLDLRKNSPTYGKVECVTLSCEQNNLLLVPCGVANAYLIEKDDTTVFYHLTSQYMPQYDGGVRWDTVGLDLGNIRPIISDRDQNLPRFDQFESPFVWCE